MLLNYQFSVLLSIYYKENVNHFSMAMKSIWHDQTIKPDEIILVEDGVLTDELYQEILHWKTILGEKLKIAELPKNRGTGYAKNIGLSICRYPLVLIMDTDDISLPDRFEKQINYMINNPDIDVLGGQIQEFLQIQNDIESSRVVPILHKDIKKLALKRNPFNHMTVCIKKDAMLSVGGYHHHLFMEDYNLFLRLLAKGYTCHNLAECLVDVRIGNAMHARRRGIVYMKSEWELAKLKIELNLQNQFLAYFYFILRLLPRLLPSVLLGLLYRILRK
ncbi:amylovoran biosynthesis protein AmsE [Chelonobacter oris]|uniref:glycosyltransferase n=1 Tax=Chelonobacter oris TaxID=505317 RepID=UPI002449141E|nr:glycosyltransferase [Chelonobacter oris]MDH3000856.1 amylovoran biosynthesis protein AmsE [Chelonobacter oris]